MFDRKTTRSLLISVGACVTIAPLVSCGGPDPRLIRVPLDARTIQAGVDAARDGDMVLVSPGTYREAVKITAPGITLRGTDRNRVVLDGGDRLQNGISATADRVSVENLTVRRYQSNGVLITGAYGKAEGAGRPDGQDVPDVSNEEPVHGYRVAWVTAFNNGLYGIYAFVAEGGVIEHTATSGHPDSGIYVGQCRPCNATVRDNLAERNAIGYFATNTTDGPVVEGNRFIHNRLGLALNSDDAERLAPGGKNIVRSNLISHNDDSLQAPEIEEGFHGGGIGIAGGIDNLITGNTVVDNGEVGVLLLPKGRYLPRDTRITGNSVRGQRIDLAYESAGPIRGNCFAGNRFRTSQPGAIERVMPCENRKRVISPYRFSSRPAPDGPDYRTMRPPVPQGGMPGDLRRWRAASDR